MAKNGIARAYEHLNRLKKLGYTLCMSFPKDKNQIMWNLYDDTIATIIWIMMSKHDTVLYSNSYRKAFFVNNQKETE